MPYCGMTKGTSWDETTLNSEKNQARIVLAVIKLFLPEGIRQLVKNPLNDNL